MGNYHSKLRRIGCLKISIHGEEKRGQQTHRNIKRLKWFEINDLPNLPDGDKASMESKKQRVEYVKK